MSFNFDEQLKFGLSTKIDGNMQIASQVRDFLAEKNLANKILVQPTLVHGNQVAVIKNQTALPLVGPSDALITSQTKYLLALTVADCLPIYFYDSSRQVIGLAHAGWRGVVKEIAPAVISQMQAHYQSDYKNIFVFIGPHLQACHFQVQADVAQLFFPDLPQSSEREIFINLAQAVSQQLTTLGVPPENIIHSSECTFCSVDKYFSWRRDRPNKLQTMLAYIALN